MMCFLYYMILKNPNILGEKRIKIEIVSMIQKNILVFLLDFLFSMMLYDQYIRIVVKITNRGLYLAIPAK